MRLNVPELSEQLRGARAEVEVLDIDFLSLEASVRYLGMIDSANDAETLFHSETEAEGEPESITEINKEDLSPDAYPGPSQ